MAVTATMEAPSAMPMRPVTNTAPARQIIAMQKKLTTVRRSSGRMTTIVEKKRYGMISATTAALCGRSPSSTPKETATAFPPAKG